MSKGMKILAGAVLIVVLAGLFVAVPAFAQGPNPPAPESPYGWHPCSRGFGFWGGGSWAVFDAAAEALGLTPEGLFTELHAGNSLAEIADAQGVDLQAVYDAMNAARIEARKAAIQQAVEEGRLTQAQADWMLEGLEQGFMPMGRGFGHHFGFHGRHGWFGH